MTSARRFSPGDAARRDLHPGDRERSDRLAREDAVAPEAPHDGREKPAAADGHRDALDLLVAAASEMSVCPPCQGNRSFMYSSLWNGLLEPSYLDNLVHPGAAMAAPGRR
ncbi:hypothetical protein, partial [Streptomyces sp900116325]|uniref:hypothetical protein n=1 Tax=Streptomyces sp. 900116325 TaxID=3154295 RepID=UPI0033A51561